MRTAVHLSKVVNRAPSSAMKTASRLAGSIALAFSLTRCLLPGGSKRLKALQTLSRSGRGVLDLIAPEKRHKCEDIRRDDARLTCPLVHSLQ